MSTNNNLGNVSASDSSIDIYEDCLSEKLSFSFVNARMTVKTNPLGSAIDIEIPSELIEKIISIYNRAGFAFQHHTSVID
jgi:hypothetical protein